jgi:hypothetical protein
MAYIKARALHVPPKGLHSGEAVRASEFLPNEIPVGEEKPKPGFPSECYWWTEQAYKLLVSVFKCSDYIH